MKRLALVAATAVFALSASAVDDVLIAECAMIEGDLARLVCFDKIASDAGLAGPQAQDSGVVGAGKWQVEVSVNPVDDSKTVRLVLFADSGQSKYGRSPALAVRCQSSKTELYINWDSYLGREAEVLTRVGSDRAQTRSWGMSTDSKATFAPNSISLLKDMLGSNKMVAQITPYNSNPITAVFDTTGLDEAIRPVRETCGW